MFRRIREWLRNSSHFHVRARGIDSVADLVDLIDRFIDGKVKYPLEWDDFISWTHSNPNIEKIRTRIEEHERLLFSKNPAEKTKYVAILIEERNNAAALIGMPARGTAN